MSTKVQVGDYLYKLRYYTHPFKRFDRVVTKRKINKISYNCARFVDKDSVPLHAINNTLIDEWYSSKDKMYKGKLEAYLKENKEVLAEIEYLKKKVCNLSQNNTKEVRHSSH